MMSRKIVIKAGDVRAEGVLNDTSTANAVWENLPLTGKANTWGDEIYFAIPVKEVVESTAKEVVEMGDLGYWPPGRAFCIFFGPTPASTGAEIRPASAVNIIGRVEGDPTVFKKVKEGTRIQIDPA
ncbi:MAG: cyclophilin-like fold protein [Candidatus Methylomirabilales bacterium]